MTHQAKVAALLCYEDGLLSADGQRRLEGHLAACDVCREALAAMRVFDGLRDDVDEEPIPALDFAVMGQRLDWEGRRAAKAIRDERRTPWAMGLAAAAVVLLGFGISGGIVSDPPSAGRAGSARITDETPRPPRTAEVTLAAGEVTIDGDPAVRPGTTVAQGARVRTGARSEAHLRIAVDTGLVVHSETELAFAGLTEGRVRVEVLAGTVSNEVAPLGPGDRYEITAGAYRVAVRGTRFAVSRDGEGVAVAVDEGVVEVFRGAFLEARVPAPSRWQSGFAMEAQAEVARPAALSTEAASWPVLQVSTGTGTDAGGIRIADRAYHVAGSAALRVPPGPIAVTYAGTPGRPPVTRIVEVGVGGAVAEGPPLTGDAPAVAMGHLAPALIAPPVRAGMRRLQGCHEQEARRGDPPSGVFALRVTIGLLGQVQRAQLIQRAGEAPSALFRRCVVDEAKRWSFPPPTGGIVTFEQPLRFTTRMN